MNDETETLISKVPSEAMDALEISGTAWGRKNWNSYTSVQFPDFDLCYDVYPGKRFDIIFAEQVLEHVQFPYRAVRNVYKMLKPSGYFLCTTPFLIQIHGGEMDYTRWSPRGMKFLLADCGFREETITVGGWGNRQCIMTDLNGCAEGRGWAWYDETQHSLENEPEYPVVVWVLARNV
jgi:SAM-dependent methyltransferase